MPIDSPDQPHLPGRPGRERGPQSPPGADDLPPLTVRFTSTDEQLRISVAGELDYYSAPALDAALGRDLSWRPSVLLDLTDLSFMDSSGLALVMRLHRDVQSAGRELALRVREGPIDRLLHISHLVDYLHVTTDPSP